MDSQIVVANTTAFCQENKIKATPARVKAWKKWQEKGMSISEIAVSVCCSNIMCFCPCFYKQQEVRIVLPLVGLQSISDQTVTEYIMDCCMLGFEVDWERLSKETGFYKVVKEVQAGIERAGATNRLKPIKNQVPKHVSYVHIKMFLMMQRLKLPDPCNLIGDFKEDRLPDYEEASSDDNNSQAKRIKQSSVQPQWKADYGYEKLTEENLLDWLGEQNEVSIQDMLRAFSTNKSSLLTLLNELEEDFLIYKRNNLYRII